jgi:uncharacterized protein HemX
LEQEDQEKEQSNGTAGYLQKVGLVVLGAIIGIVPSYIMADRQAKIQITQFLLDRQVSTLKEYSTSLNQIGARQLSGVRELFDKLEMLEAEAELTDDGNLPDDAKKVEELQKLVRNISASSDEFFGNLNTQRTMVYAVFGSKPEPTPLLPDNEIKKWRERWAKSFNEAVTDLEMVRRLKQLFRELEQIITFALNEHNKDVEKLVLKIQEQQNIFD